MKNYIFAYGYVLLCIVGYILRVGTEHLVEMLLYCLGITILYWIIKVYNKIEEVK